MTTKKPLKATKLINKTKPFSLTKRMDESKFKAYFISAYSGKNRRCSRILCYKKTDIEAIKVFNETISKFKSGSIPKKFIETNVKVLTKHDNPNYIHNDEIIWRGTLGKKLEAFLNKKQAEPTSDNYKHTIRWVTNKLNDLIGREENLTKEFIDRVFDSITKVDAHLSPESIRSYKNVLRQLCTHLDLDEKKLMKGFVIQTKTQLKKRDIKFNEKNRRHLERSEIKKLLVKLMECEDIVVRSNIFMLLWLGIRPGDLLNIEEIKDKIVVITSKTDTLCQFEKDKYFEAYRLITDITLKGLNQYKSNEYFMELTNKLFGSRLDQYCIRHTVISHRVLYGESLKLITQESGHATLRMLDSNYAKKIMNEGSSIDGEIIFKNVLKPTYRHWLIQELLLIRWPNLKSKKPTDEFYGVVIEILKSVEKSRVAQIDL